MNVGIKNVNGTNSNKTISKNSSDNLKTSTSSVSKQTYNKMTPVENTDNLSRNSKPVSNLVHRHSNPASTYTTSNTLGLHNQISRTRTTLQDSANALPRIKIQS